MCARNFERRVFMAFPIAVLAAAGCTWIGGSSGSSPVVGIAEPRTQSIRAAGTTYTEHVLYRFKGSPDGANPEAGVVKGPGGELVGTTVEGGADTNCPGGFANGCGTVFAIDAAGDERVVYSFAGTPDGNGPFDDLVSDSAGDLFGDTAAGGHSKICL